MNSYFIATQQLYILPSLSAYTKAQKQHLYRLNDYKKKTIIERWDFILEKLKPFVPNASQLETFQNARKSISTNSYNLSLNNCLDYFEHFYFFYTTNESNFKLSDFQKKYLGELIDDAITSCETGLSMRFESGLQQYRAGDNWIQKKLADKRHEIIRGMHDDYNNENNVSPALRIHVLKIMAEEAINNKLSIKFDHNLKDVFETSLSKNKIVLYFNRHYPELFREYELTAAQYLTEELLNEINTLFCPPECHWRTNQHTNFTIPATRVEEFIRLIKNRLELCEKKAIAYDLGTLDDEGNFIINNQKHVATLLCQQFEEKLSNDFYYCDIKNIRKNNPAIKNLYLKKGISFAHLININEVLLSDPLCLDTLISLFKKHPHIILHYPELLLAHLDKHPILVSILPKALKNNTYFIEKAIGHISKSLLVSILQKNEEEIETKTHYLFTLIESHAETSYLESLPEELFNNRIFVNKLLEKNGLLLSKLPTLMREDEAIVRIAVQQNKFALYYAKNKLQDNLLQQIFSEEFLLPTLADNEQIIESIYSQLWEKLPILFSGDFKQNPKEFSNKFALVHAIEKMQSIVKLTASETSNMSQEQIIQFAQNISPSCLITIYTYRQAKKLAPLWGCRELSILKKFEKKMQKHLRNTWEDDFLLAKKTLNILTQSGLKRHGTYFNSPIDYLSKTNNWFLAFLQYQQAHFGAFNTWKQLKDELRKLMLLTIKFLATIALTIAQIGVSLYLVEIYWSLFILLPDYLLYPLYIYRMILIIFGGANNPFFMRTNSLLRDLRNNILCLDCIIVAYSILWAGIGVIFSFGLMKKIINFLPHFIKRIENTLYSTETNAQPTLYDQCQQIIERLAEMSDEAANEKADVLKKLFKQAIQESSDSVNNLLQINPKQLAQNLNKTYTIEYKGKKYQLSFFQAAAIKRDNKTFYPNVQSAYCFFKTTSSKRLDQLKIPEQTLMALS